MAAIAIPVGTDFERMVEALRDPRCYSALDFPPGVERPARLELLETHISCILLAGVHAYKVKKPVNLGFLDFTTLEARRFYCGEEVRLNRRTAPTLYLDVVPIAGTPSRPLPGALGPVIDYAVRMRRFPQHALLDQMARDRQLAPECLEKLGAVVAAFHLALPPAAPESRYASAEQVLSAAVQNFDQVEVLAYPRNAVATLQGLRAWTSSEHASLAKVFDDRKADGFVRECHGDLHLRNIVMLGGEPVPFDCLEFNADFRWIDVMNEIAFLVMDLEEHGYPGLAFRFLNRYLETTADYAGLRVLRFYVAYRAMVRAKIACIRGAQPGIEPQARVNAESDFSRYLEVAEKAAAGGRGGIVLMHGPSGSGKSTMARQLAEALGAIHLRSDVERKRMHGLGAGARTQSDPGAGIYGPTATERTYARLAGMAKDAVGGGYPVIVDATCLAADQRAPFRRLAQDTGVPLAIVSCNAPEAVLRERVARREAQGDDASEAGLAVLERQLASCAPLSMAEQGAAVEIDTRKSTGLPPSVTAVLAARLFGLHLR